MAIGRIAPDRRLFCYLAGPARASLNPRRKVRPGREGGQRPDPPFNFDRGAGTLPRPPMLGRLGPNSPEQCSEREEIEPIAALSSQRSSSSIQSDAFRCTWTPPNG